MLLVENHHDCFHGVYHDCGELRTLTLTETISSTLCLAEFPKEDRVILMRFYKPLTETVQCDVIIPKLVQIGLLTHEEKNSINLGARNVDRMKNLLSMLPKKSIHAFEIFCDCLKFKYAPIYEQLVKAKQIAAQKPGQSLHLV